MRIAVLALVLAACSTPQQRAMQAPETYGPVCQRYGFQPGTDAYAACIQKAYADDESRRMAGAALLHHAPITCRSVGTATTCQ